MPVDLIPARRAGSEGRRKSLRRKAKTLAGASGWYPNRRPRSAAGTVNLRSGTLGRSSRIGCPRSWTRIVVRNTVRFPGISTTIANADRQARTPADDAHSWYFPAKNREFFILDAHTTYGEKHPNRSVGMNPFSQS